MVLVKFSGFIFEIFWPEKLSSKLMRSQIHFWLNLFDSHSLLLTNFFPYQDFLIVVSFRSFRSNSNFSFLKSQKLTRNVKTSNFFLRVFKQLSTFTIYDLFVKLWSVVKKDYRYVSNSFLHLY